MRIWIPLAFWLLALAAIAAPAQARRACLTHAERSALARAAIAPARPPSVDAVDSATHPMRVHRPAGVSMERAQLLVRFLDDAWDLQVDGAGFPPPLLDGSNGTSDDGGDDKLDVYLTALPEDAAGITVALQDASPTDGQRAAPAFIELDPGLPDDLLEVFAHHEFQHVLQFTIDTAQSAMWSESTAVLWEVRARPDVTDWQSALPAFQQQPQAPLGTDGARFAAWSLQDDLRYEYGAVLFALYLDDVHGDGRGTLLRTLWQGCAQGNSVEGNEPDWMDAALAADLDLAAMLPDFASWRALVGVLRVPDQGPSAAIAEEARLRTGVVLPEALDGRATLTEDVDGPFAWGCVIRSVEVPAQLSGPTLPLNVQAEGTLPDQRLAVGLLVVDPVAHTATRTVQMDAANAHVDAAPGSIVHVAVCDVSAVDADDEPQPRPIRVRLLRTDVVFPAPDAGADPDLDAGPRTAPPAEAPSCGCQSARDPRTTRRVLGVAGTVVGLLVFGLRVWRTRARKNLYRSSVKANKEGS